MSKTVLSLIALVPTAVMVDGERQIIQPGQPLPELKPADSAALVGAKAAREAIAEPALAEPAPAAPAPAAPAVPTPPAASANDGAGSDPATASSPAATAAPTAVAKSRKR